MRILVVACVALCGLCAVPGRSPAADEKPQRIESLEFREVDIKDVLRQLATQYDLNIVFSESVRGVVTVHLTKVSIDQALDSIITVNGFAYSKKENVYKVTSQEEARREGRQTKLFKLNNAEAAKIKETLAKVLSGDGSIEADARSNSIVVTDSPSVLAKIDGMIASLDELTPQVLIEAKLVETSLTSAEKLGIDWQTTIKATGAKRPITFPFTTQEASKYNPTVDGGTVGESWPTADADEFTFGTLDFTGVQMVFDALKSRSKTHLVANPRIITLNNHNATINVGKVLSQPTYERNATTGKLEVTGWQSYNVGVSLDVTPQISPDGHVKLKLKPEVSSLIGYASTRDGVNEGPITSSRSAQTEVQLKDGQTVVIGGLVKEESLTTESKIPFLGDLPLIGWLFKSRQTGSTSNPSEKTDLLIFVTVRIIKDGETPPVPEPTVDVDEAPRRGKVAKNAAAADNKAPVKKEAVKAPEVKPAPVPVTAVPVVVSERLFKTEFREKQ